MAKLPLLFFPSPTMVGRAKRFGGGGGIKLPDHQAHAGRLAPKFQRLQDAMVNIRDTTAGIEPEMVLVLETVGTQLDFYNAVRNIPGLRWLSEMDVDDVAPDHGFADEAKPDKKLRGRFFVVMSDQQALHNLKSLFDRWRKDPDIVFSRGLSQWKQVFNHLLEIRRWSVKDRIEDTGIIQDWRQRVSTGQENIGFEAEFWFRQGEARRNHTEDRFRKTVVDMGGEIVTRCAIEEIAYHAVLGKIPAEQCEGILNCEDVSSFWFEDMMHLRPMGQCAVRIPVDEPTGAISEMEQMSKRPQGQPTVALFDGLPLAGHQLFDGGWLKIDDPDGYSEEYEAQKRRHGTAMASLICFGDLENEDSPISSPLYVRPIMRPDANIEGRERIPEDVLPVDLVHRAVRRLFEPEGGAPAVAPSIRIINLSVGDKARHFVHDISPWARLLDWLSYKYNVLFVVSAGNQSEAIELNMPRAEYEKLTPEQREVEILKALDKDTRHRRLLSPAEALNGVTVGSFHGDYSSPVPSTGLKDPYVTEHLPALYSAHGHGYRGTIKPDILLPGGRQFVQQEEGGARNETRLRLNESPIIPGNEAASPGGPGVRGKTKHTRGTSNAAALASRAGAQLLESINNLREQTPSVDILSQYEPLLVKALLVHGASWGDALLACEEALKNSANSQSFRMYVSRFLGYGVADISRSLACTEQRVTVLGFGSLQQDKAHEFRLPLPSCMSGRRGKRRMATTLAWFTPIRPLRQKYRAAHLWFNPKEACEKLGLARSDADHRAVNRGTIQHEVLEGERAVAIPEGESVAITVNCRADAEPLTEDVFYALAVTLESAEDTDIPVYQEVHEQLVVASRVR